RASCSSSTISTRIFSTGLSLRLSFNRRFSVEWECGGDDQTASFGIARFKAVGRAVQIVKPGARIRQADSLDQVAVRDAQPRAVVAHLKINHPVLTFGANGDQASCFAVGDPVPDGIFNQWLKEKLGNERVKGRRVNLHPHRQPIPKAVLLDFQIAFENFQLLPEFYFVRRIPGQGDAQQAAELEQHPVSRLNVPAHQHGDAVERVEEEVRMQLHSQRVELRPHEAGFEVRRLQLPALIPAVIIRRLVDGDDHPVNQLSGEELCNRETPEQFDEWSCVRERAGNQSSREDENDFVGGEEKYGGNRMYSDEAE